MKSPDLAWFRSLHYGSTHVCLWWCIYPDGRLYIARELVRTRGLISDFCLAIRTQTRDLKIAAIRYTIADKDQMSGKVKGGAKGETRAETFRVNRIILRETTHDPIQGWTRVGELFGMRQDGRPWLTIDPRCETLTRALTTAVSDPKDAESVLATNADADAVLFALRVGAMSRPSPRPFEPPPLSPNAVGHLLNECRIEAGMGTGYGRLAWK